MDVVLNTVSTPVCVSACAVSVSMLFDVTVLLLVTVVKPLVPLVTVLEE